MKARTISVQYDQLTRGGSVQVTWLRGTGVYVFKGFDQVEITPDEFRRLADEMSAMHLSNHPDSWEYEEPAPQATAPDRPSNVGQLNPTVELPDLGEMDF